jgi:hypothetical protein
LAPENGITDASSIKELAGKLAKPRVFPRPFGQIRNTQMANVMHAPLGKKFKDSRVWLEGI